MCNQARYITPLVIGVIIIALSSCQTNKSNEVFKDVFADLVINSNIYPLNELQPPPPYVSMDTSKSKEIIMLDEGLNKMSFKVKTLEKFISSTHEITILNRLLPTSYKYFQSPDNGSESSLYDTTWIGNVDGKIRNQHVSFNLNKSDFQLPNYKITFICKIPKSSSTFDYAAEHEDVIVVQLSNVVFNKDENKGLFYFSISKIENTACYMKFCYVQKIHGKWKIIKTE
jgi:hypothetical protein